MSSRLLPMLGAVASALVIGGCASYHPLPLPEHARLADSIDDIRHTVPAAAPGAKAGVIDVSQPLSVDQVGLLAILNDPELRTERGESDLARADLTQSAMLPNPSVSLSYAALLGGPGTTGADELDAAHARRALAPGIAAQGCPAIATAWRSPRNGGGCTASAAPDG